VAVCVQEGIALRFQHLDTPSFSLSGDARPDSDEPAIPSTHGSSKDHRPDCKQAVLALRVSQEGGGPVGRKSWDGHASETPIFQERAAVLMQTLQRSPTPGSLGAASKRSNEETAPTLAPRGVLPRMPGTLTLVSQVIRPALTWDMGPRLADTPRYGRLEWWHYGMAPRWRVGSAQAALERAHTRVDTACQRASATIHKPLFPLQAQRFETPEAAHSALDTLATS
jgi:hypothetical protein